MTSPSPDQPPPGWGTDKLSNFLSDATRNQFATLANLTGSYRRLRDVDDVFEQLAGEVRCVENGL